MAGPGGIGLPCNDNGGGDAMASLTGDMGLDVDVGPVPGAELPVLGRCGAILELVETVDADPDVASVGLEGMSGVPLA
jgi:hypothetical protein